MRLGGLIQPIEKMSDEELLSRLQQVRHNREVARPVAARKIATGKKKESNKTNSAMQKLLDGLSPEDRAALIKQLEEGQ